MNRPTEEQIQRRAYEIYLKDGKPGRDVQNWLQAERELTETIERDEREASIWEDTSSRRTDGNIKVKARSNRREEFKKGF